MEAHLRYPLSILHIVYFGQKPLSLRLAINNLLKIMFAMHYVSWRSRFLSSLVNRCHLKVQYTGFMPQFINTFFILLFIHVFLWNQWTHQSFENVKLQVLQGHLGESWSALLKESMLWETFAFCVQCSSTGVQLLCSARTSVQSHTGRTQHQEKASESKFFFYSSSKKKFFFYKKRIRVIRY